jgi:hypothetical protein
MARPSTFANDRDSRSALLRLVPYSGIRVGYGAETQIQRKDFGLNVDMLMDGRLVVGNEIQITIQGELVETADEPAGAAS